MIAITNTVKHLIIINVLFFIAKYSIPQYNLDTLFDLHYFSNPNFKYWQLVTSIFMHADIGHLFFNMLGLYFFGTALEQLWGRDKFLFFYFSAGIGSSLIYQAYNFYQFESAVQNILTYTSEVNKIDLLNLFKNSQYINNPATNEASINAIQIFNTPMLGASGAIFGLLAAFGWNFPDAKMFLIFLPIPIAAKYFIPVLVLGDLYSGITGHPIFSPVNTAYFAHVGGALIGLMIAIIWKKKSFNHF